MIIRLLAGLAAAFAILCVTATARAQNDQTVVIGLGGGGYTAEADEVRSDRYLAMSHVYVEWYAFDTLGVGFRRTVLYDGTGLIVLSGLEALSVQTNVLTAHWIVYGERDYARVGLVGGVGIATYEYDDVIFGGAVRGHVKTSGPAALAGVYLDWGADGFGGRLGYDTISTHLDDVAVSAGDTRSANATGSGPYVDVRRAF